MKQKILFFDIDGTLIDEETDVVPESAKKALAAAKEKGHLLFICSGRCLAIIPQNVVELGFDGLIGGCGTYIEMEGKEVYHHTLPMELQKEIIKDLEKYHIDGVLEGKDCSAFRRDYWMPKVVSIFTENVLPRVRSVTGMKNFLLIRWHCGLMSRRIWQLFAKNTRRSLILSNATRRFTRWFRKEFPKRLALKKCVKCF